MTEADFRAFVKEQVTTKAGWILVADFSDRRRMPPGLKGIPDLLFGIPSKSDYVAPALVWFEAKSKTGKLNIAQIEWMQNAMLLFWARHRYVVASTWAEFVAAVGDLLPEDALTWAN